MQQYFLQVGPELKLPPGISLALVVDIPGTAVQANSINNIITYLFSWLYFCQVTSSRLVPSRRLQVDFKLL